MKSKYTWVCMLSSLAFGGCATDVAPSEEPVANSTAAVFATNGDVVLNWKAKDRAVVSSGAERLDLFLINPDGNLDYHPYAHSTGWRPKVQLQRPGVLHLLSKVAAVKNGPGHRIDVFAVTMTEKIKHRFKTGPGDGDWSPWFDIINAPTVLENTSITATSWSDGRLDLFWWTPSRNIGHAWAINNQWSGAESGDTAAKTYLQPVNSSGGDLAAVSWGPNRIDLFYPGGSQLHHHWFATGWKPRESLNLWDADAQRPFTSMSVAVASKAANQIEVLLTAFADDIEIDIYRTAFSNAWPIVAGLGNTVAFEKVEHDNTAAPDIVDTAVWWGNGARIDIFGRGPDQKTWQAWR